MARAFSWAELSDAFRLQRKFQRSLVTGGGTVELDGRIDSVTTITGQLSAAVELAGAVDSHTSITGSLVAATELGGTVDSVTTITGALTASSELSGSVASSTGITGELLVEANLSGEVGSSTGITGELSVTGAPPVPTPTPEQPGSGSGFIFGDGFDFFEGPRTKRKPKRPQPRTPPHAPAPHVSAPLRTPQHKEAQPEPVLTPSILDSLAEVPVVKPPVPRETPLAEARRPVERFPETSTEVHAISPATQPLSRAAIARAKAEAEAQRIAREAQLESEDIEAITAILLAMDL